MKNLVKEFMESLEDKEMRVLLSDYIEKGTEESISLCFDKIVGGKQNETEENNA